MRLHLILSSLLFSYATKAQLYVQQHSGMYLQSGSELSVKGNIVIHDDIAGDGYLVANDSVIQYGDFHGKSIPNFVLANHSDFSLQGDMLVRQNLQLLNGKLICESSSITVNGASPVFVSPGSYIVTNGKGRLRKSLPRSLERYCLPIGTPESYQPLFISGKATTETEYIEVASRSGRNPNRPSGVHEYLDHYWELNQLSTRKDLVVESLAENGKSSNLTPFIFSNGQWKQQAHPNRSPTGVLVFHPAPGRNDLYAMNTREYISGLSPNPARTFSNFVYYSEKGCPAILQISDDRGRLITTSRMYLVAGRNSIPVQVSALPSGTYIIKLSGDNKVQIHSLIKL